MRCACAVLLWVLAVLPAAAQSLVFGPERPLEVPPHPIFATDMQLASSGGAYAALWRSDRGELVSTLIDSDGQMQAASAHVLAPKAGPSALAGNAAGYLAVWTEGERLVWTAIPRDGGKPAPSRSWGETELLDFRLAATEREFILVWRARGAYAAARIAVISADGRLVQSLTILTDASAGPIGVTAAGPHYILAYRTPRGLEVLTIDALRVSLIARRVDPDIGGDPLLVNTATGVAAFFSLSLNGWNDDAATYRVDLSQRASAQPEFVTYGQILDALVVDGAAVLVVRNDSATDIVGLPLRFIDFDSIAWSGTRYLIAAGKPVEHLAVMNREGEQLRTTPFASRDRFPRALARAGDVDLVLWHEFSDLDRVWYGRFRGGRLIDSPPSLVDRGTRTEIASDGQASFLVAFRDQSKRIYARVLPAAGAAAHDPLFLGTGTLHTAIWDGNDFLVFFNAGAQLHVARVRSDGTLLAESDLHDFPYAGYFAPSGLVAARTKSGFAVADQAGRFAAYTRSFTFLNGWTNYFAGDPLTLASDGGEHVVAGVVRRELGSRMYRLDDRAHLLWSAPGAPLKVTWSRGTFISCDEDCVLLEAEEPIYSLFELPRFPLPPHEGELFLANENGQPAMLYGDSQARMFLRTLTVLPKPEAAP